MESHTITLAGINGEPITIECEISVVGDFAAHLTPGETSYQLTHIPSGYGVFAGRGHDGHVWGWRCLDDAAAFAAKLCAALEPGDIYRSTTGAWKVKHRAKRAVRQLYMELWKRR